MKTQPLLIHSMSELSMITLPILQAVNARYICEIGSEFGGNTKIIYDWIEHTQGKLTCIDPKPGEEFTAWIRGRNNITHIAELSLSSIEKVDSIDAWFVDGDHNWYTVYNELLQIHENSKKNKKPLLIFLHDVSWPCARRDAYYNPSVIPKEFCHPHSYELGVTFEQSNLIQGGFRGMGQFAFSLHEGGKRNGVLTAIEDFMEQNPDQFYFGYVPAVFGLGVLFDKAHPQYAEIADILSIYHDNTLLAILEINRIRNYLKVIELQDAIEKEKMIQKV